MGPVCIFPHDMAARGWLISKSQPNGQCSTIVVGAQFQLDAGWVSLPVNGYAALLLSRPDFPHGREDVP